MPTGRLRKISGHVLPDLEKDEASEEKDGYDTGKQESPRPDPQLDRSQFENDQKDQERKESLEYSLESRQDIYLVPSPDCFSEAHHHHEDQIDCGRDS